MRKAESSYRSIPLIRYANEALYRSKQVTCHCHQGKIFKSSTSGAMWTTPTDVSGSLQVSTMGNASNILIYSTGNRYDSCIRFLVSGLVSLSSLLVLGPMCGAQPAEAKDYEAMKAEKEARKKALREAAGEIKSTGKDVAQVSALKTPSRFINVNYAHDMCCV